MLLSNKFVLPRTNLKAKANRSYYLTLNGEIQGQGHKVKVIIKDMSSRSIHMQSNKFVLTTEHRLNMKVNQNMEDRQTGNINP